MRSDYKLAQGNVEVFDIYFTIGGFYEIFVTSHKVFFFLNLLSIPIKHYSYPKKDMGR